MMHFFPSLFTILGEKKYILKIKSTIFIHHHIITPQFFFCYLEKRWRRQQQRVLDIYTLNDWEKNTVDTTGGFSGTEPIWSTCIICVDDTSSRNTMNSPTDTKKEKNDVKKKEIKKRMKSINIKKVIWDTKQK
jgi:hypothetical protein